MSQNFTSDWYEITYNVDTGQQQAENNDNVLRSNFSGPTSPAVGAVAGQFWYDTDTGTLKHRNVANNAWRGTLVGDANFKVWLYTNDQQEGMLIDDSVQDVVLALRGVNYGSSGGVPAGDWAISGLVVQGHTLTIDEIPNHSHSAGAGSNFLVQVGSNLGQSGNSYGSQSDTGSIGGGQSHSHGITHNSAWRPAAAVGTLQYPNLA